MMTPQQTQAVEQLIRCAGSGMGWMSQVSNSKLSHKTRALLELDMALCQLGIAVARSMLAEDKGEFP